MPCQDPSPKPSEVYYGWCKILSISGRKTKIQGLQLGVTTQDGDAGHLHPRKSRQCRKGAVFLRDHHAGGGEGPKLRILG